MDLKSVLESILFSSQKPLSLRELREILSATADRPEESPAKEFKKVRDEEIEPLLESLEKEHEAAGRTYRLACVAGAWQFVCLPDYAPWLKTLFGEKTRPPRLSQPALETMAIIAYREPITRAEIEQVRGVAVDGVITTLLERGLIAEAGRAEVIGRPMRYKTTSLFLEYFGLRGLEQLPAADELRRIPVTKPEALVTAELTPQQPELTAVVEPVAEAVVEPSAEPATESSETPAEPVVETAPTPES